MIIKETEKKLESLCVELKNFKKTEKDLQLSFMVAIILIFYLG